MAHIDDRRHRRSEDASLALRYQLDAIRADAASEAVLVADDTGLCLASSGERALCEELAAWLPLLGSLEGLGDGHDVEALGRPIAVRRVQIEQTRLYVCAVGRQSQRSLDASAGGIARILA